MLDQKHQSQLTVKHRLLLTIQFCSLSNKEHRSFLPRNILKQWIVAALEKNAIITLRFVDAQEAQKINMLYRGKNYVPNVLTFVYNENDHEFNFNASEKQVINADIVLCCKKIAEEALIQKKSLTAHYAHLIVHGVLHAQGHDHKKQHDAIKMEYKEIEILKTLGFPSPY